MKTFTIILTVLIATTVESNAQIPNSGFETWVNYEDDVTGYVYEKPNFWNGELPNSLVNHSYSIQKNPESYPAGTGQYSMKIQPDIANGVRGVAGTDDDSKLGHAGDTLISLPTNSDAPVNGILPPTFAINYRPASLYLYYKCFPYSGDTIVCMVNFYKNGVLIGNGVFATTATVPTWTPLEITITYNSLDVPDSATIFFMTGIYIQHSTESTLYVDNLNFDTPITSASLTSNEFPIKFNLAQNYPNPFNPTTTISYSEPKKSFVTLEVFNVLGSKVATLVNSEKSPGNYDAVFDGSRLPSGVYFYRLEAGTYHDTKKLLLLK